MARDFDDFPTYDPVLKDGELYLSNIWSDFLATFVETLQEYLGQYGMFVPRMTTAQRDSIQSPVEGQFIYNTDVAVGPPATPALQVWQAKAGVSAWRSITTVP